MNTAFVKKHIDSVCASILVLLGISISIHHEVSFLLDGMYLDLASSMIMIFSYVFSFLIYRRANKSTYIAPSFTIRVDAESVALIFASLGLLFAGSYIVGLFDFGGPATPPVQYHAEGIVIFFFSSVLVPAFFEELFFRGLIMTNLLPLGKRFSIIAGGMIFGLAHGNHDQVFFASAAGILLGYLYYKSGSLWPGIILHMLNNLIACVDTVLRGTLGAELAMKLCAVIDITVFILGAVSIAYLILVYKREREAKKKDGIFGEERHSLPACNTDLTIKEYVKGFFSPAMIVFLGYFLVSEMIYVRLF